MNILILIFCLLYFGLAFYRLDWALMFLIATTPSYLIRFEILGIPFTILEAMILMSFAAWLLKNYKQIIQNLKIKFSVGNCKLKIVNCKLNRYPFDVEIILLLIISFAAVAVSGFSDGALGIWKAYFFEPALLFILILNIFRGEKGVKKILWSLSISALAVSVLAIYQKFTGVWIFNEFWRAEETRRVTSFFGYPNAVGLFLAPLVLIFMGWLIGNIKNFQFFPPQRDPAFAVAIFNKKIFNFKLFLTNFFISLIIISSLFAVYFARSEGALIGVLAGIAVFGILAGRRARWMTIILGIVVISVIMLYAPIRDYAIDKITLNDLSGQIRKVQWRETKKMLLDGRAITGAGLANYKQAVAPYHEEGLFVKNDDPNFLEKVRSSAEYRKKVWQPLEIYLYPHNIFLNFWSELGIFGVILFVWIIGKFLYIGLKIIVNCKLPPQMRGSAVAGKIENLEVLKSKYIVLGLMGAMIVLMMHGLVDVPYFKNDLAIIFWIMVAMLSIIKLNFESEKNEK